jgi:hypothetical protein
VQLSHHSDVSMHQRAAIFRHHDDGLAVDHELLGIKRRTRVNR